MRLTFFFLHIRSLLISCEYVSVESIHCILLSTLELKAVFLISSVKTLRLSLLNLCCVFNITFFYFVISLSLSAFLSFLNSLYFKFEMLLGHDKKT